MRPFQSTRPIAGAALALAFACASTSAFAQYGGYGGGYGGPPPGPYGGPPPGYGGGGGYGGGAPGGSYRRSCTNIRQDGPILSADCQTIRGGYRSSSIDLRRCGRVGNNNGRLVCE